MTGSNFRFNVSDTLIVTVNSVTMPVVFGRAAINQKGRPLAKENHREGGSRRELFSARSHNSDNQINVLTICLIGKAVSNVPLLTDYSRRQASI